MKYFFRSAGLGLLGFSLFACAGTTKNVSFSDAIDAVEEDDVLDLEAAESLIAEIESTHPWPSSSFQEPQSVDDVVAILKLDDVRRFEDGLRFVSSQRSLSARALEAQIELAWGEAYMVVLAVLTRLEGLLEKELQTLVDTHGEGETISWLQERLMQSERYAEAFQLVSIEHMTKGALLAENVMRDNPESYLGYRVAADYYRMIRDWMMFDKIEKKIETLKPTSNGLVFLRGAVAYRRNGDRSAASAYFRQALSNDPKFVRAQAHLLVLQETIETLAVEFRKLRAISPTHPVVLWAGETLDWLRERKGV